MHEESLGQFKVPKVWQKLPKCIWILIKASPCFLDVKKDQKCSRNGEIKWWQGGNKGLSYGKRGWVTKIEAGHGQARAGVLPTPPSKMCLQKVPKRWAFCMSPLSHTLSLPFLPKIATHTHTLQNRELDVGIECACFVTFEQGEVQVKALTTLLKMICMFSLFSLLLW